MYFLLIIVLLLAALASRGLKRLLPMPGDSRVGSPSPKVIRMTAASDVVVCIHGTPTSTTFLRSYHPYYFLAFLKVGRDAPLRPAGFQGTHVDFAHIKRRLTEKHGDAVLVVVPACNAGIRGAHRGV
jgi:hypothetical protein